MWAGTTNGLLRFSTASALWERQGSGPGVRTLYRDAQGTLWIGTNESLWRSTGGTPIRVHAPRPVPAGVDHDDYIVGRRRRMARLQRLDLSLGRHHPRAVRGARRNQHQADHARPWRSTRPSLDGVRRGAGRLRRSNRARSTSWARRTVSTTRHTLRSTRCIEGKDGVMWIGGSGGLSRFVDGRVVTVNHENGLPGNRVWAIVDDDDGDLWLSVDRGLVHRQPGRIRRRGRGTDPSHPVQAVRHVGWTRRGAARQHPCGASGRRQAVVRPRRRAHGGGAASAAGRSPAGVGAAADRSRRGQRAPLQRRAPDIVAARHQTAADQLHGVDAHRLQQDPLPLPSRRLRHRLGRRGHAPRRLLHQPLAAQLPVPGRGRYRRRPVEHGDARPGRSPSSRRSIKPTGSMRRAWRWSGSSCGAHGRAGCGSSGGNFRWCWPNGRD